MSAMAAGVLLAVACVVGLAVYEGAVRLFGGPVAVGAPAAPSAAEGPGAEAARARVRRRAEGTLSALSRALDRVAPVAGTDKEDCRARLRRAGLLLEPETWRGLRAASALLCCFATAALVAALGPGGAAAPAAAALAAAGGWLFPSLALSRLEERRRCAIEAHLPDAMELLGIALAAGSPVEQCFREVAGSLDGPLSEELAIVDQEVNLLGRTREEALENLARRCRSQEVGAFAAQLAQAISQGTSIADGLAIQASLAREQAQAAALERIRKMPTKLDIVLSLCFLPPTTVLVLVPTVVRLLEFLSDTMG